MIIFVVAAAVLTGAIALAAKGGAREMLLGMICVLSLNNLALPFHLLPIGGGRVLLTLALMGLAVLYSSIRDLNELDGRLTWIGNIVTPYNIGLVFVLILMLAYTLLTPDVDYGLAKTRGFIQSTLIPVASISIFAPFERRDLRVIVIALAVSSLLVAFQITLNPQEFGDWRFRRSVSGDIHPNNVARNLGLGVPVLLGGLLFARRLRLSGIVAALGGLGLLLIAILLTGSRGPLTAAAFAMIALILFRIRHFLTFRAAVRMLAVIAITGVAGAVLFDRYIKHQPTWNRIAYYFETFGQNTSDMSRLGRYQTAWNGFIDSKLIGVGTGGFTWLWTGPPPGGIFDGRDYPHNFVLEALVELGVPGGVLILGLTLGLVAMIVRRIRSPQALSDETAMLAAVWFYAIVNSSLSGDLATNYHMWVLGSLLWIALRWHRESVVESGVTEEDGVGLVKSGAESASAGDMAAIAMLDAKKEPKWNMVR